MLLSMRPEPATRLTVGMLVKIHTRLKVALMMIRLMRKAASGYMRNGKRIPIKLFSIPMAVKA